MTMDVDNAQSSMPREELLELLEQLRCIKRLSIPFLERWAAESSDEQLKAGLATQLAQDRQILNALTGRLEAMGERPDDGYRDEHIEAVFRELGAAGDDMLRIAGFHRSLKQYLIARYNMLLALADPGTRDIIEDLNEDEERMQRWGESRRAALGVPASLASRVIEMETRVMTLTAQSRERIAREIKERAEHVTGGIIGKRMGEIQEQLQQLMARQQPPDA